MTVYDLGPSEAVMATQRRSGRIKMLLVLAICAAPVIASYLTYFVVRPDAKSNYGTLIQPTRPMPRLTLRALDGRAVPLRSLEGQWLLVVVGPAGCDTSCEQRLYAQRQLREMLGRERERLDKVWFVTDEAEPRAALVNAAKSSPEVTVLRFDRAALAQWLTPDPGHGLEEHLYLVDPMGHWMMRFPVEFDPGKVKRDLERLLRASASWDRAGR